MLDLAKVRNAYFNPPPDEPGRVLTREELHARYERRRVEGCLRRGGDPEAGRFGRTRLLDRRSGQTAHRFRRAARTRRASSAPAARLVRLSPSTKCLSSARRCRGGPRLLCRARRRSLSGDAATSQRRAARIARFGPRNLRDASGRRCGTSSLASASGISNGFFPEADSPSMKSPEPSTAPIPAAPKSSLGSTSSRFPPASRRMPDYCQRKPRRPSSTTLVTLPIPLGNPSSSIPGDPVAHRDPE